ncbi:FAD:protein FMN transferase [Phenylobacterium sp. LjRoot219]|uniref:FAD:protein FMN transferase n=1 Tax=Phenylobacterium sp. LjRoot219 TaxID=3342283 RepID=UPI003ECC26B8
MRRTSPAKPSRRWACAPTCLEVGGEVRGCGIKPDAQPWWVALEHPEADDEDPLLIAACGVAIATSGGARRHFEHAGRRFSHTLDPASGEPVRETVLAATVLHPRCASADALATALIVMGAERALAFAARRDLPVVLTLAGETGQRRVLSPAAQAMTLED